MARKARSSSAASTRTPRRTTTKATKTTRSNLSQAQIHNNQVETVLIVSFFISIFVFAAILVYGFSFCQSMYMHSSYKMQQPLVDHVQMLEVRIDHLENQR